MHRRIGDRGASVALAVACAGPERGEDAWGSTLASLCFDLGLGNYSNASERECATTWFARTVMNGNASASSARIDIDSGIWSTKASPFTASSKAGECIIWCFGTLIKTYFECLYDQAVIALSYMLCLEPVFYLLMVRWSARRTYIASP